MNPLVVQVENELPPMPKKGVARILANTKIFAKTIYQSYD